MHHFFPSFFSSFILVHPSTCFCTRLCDFPPQFPSSSISPALCPFRYSPLQRQPQASFSQTPLRAPSKTATEHASLFFSFYLSSSFALLRMADYRSLHGLSGADPEAQLEREAENERRRGCCLFLIHKHRQCCRYKALTGHKSFICKVTWELAINMPKIHAACFLLESMHSHTHI